MKQILLALGISALLIPVQSNAQCSVFYDGFESGSFATPWDMGSGTYTMTVPTTSPAVGTYNLNMSSSGSGSHYQGPTAAFTASTPGYVSWWARTDNVTSANGYFVLGDANTSSNNGILFCYFNSGSVLRFYGSTGYNYPISANTWYHIEATNMNWTSRTMDIYVNNVLVLSAWPFRSTTTTSVDHVFLYSLNAANVDYDDIIIGSAPVTATSVMSGNMCFGDSNGSATVTASGGDGNYTYSWSSGGTAATESGLAAGTYSCTITDGVGCTTTHTVAVTEPAVLTASSVASGALCNGGSNGSIDLSPSGGTPGYVFLWSNGQTTEDISGIPAGTYSVSILDANGCTGSATGIVVTEPAALSSTISSVNVTCPGASNGSADILPAGGTGPYTYLWSPSNSSSSSISSLAAGTYFCDVVDANGCTTQASVTITEPPAFVTTTSSTDALCNGSANGTGTISVSGGTPGYSYSWSNGDMTANASALAAGTYTCTVTDTNGCTTNDVITVLEPMPLVASTTVADVSCNGACNGSADILSSGGTAPYAYAWTSGGTGSSENGLCAGTYYCNWTDANGCSAIDSVTISEPDAIVLSTTSSDPSGCSSSDGSIDLTVSGGNPSYTFSWSNAAVTEDISGLGAGVYTVVVVDINSCSDSLSVTLNQPAPPVVTLALPQDTICTADAPMTLTGGSPAGGTWSGTGVTGSTFNPATAGAGTATITYTYTDANTGCSSTASNDVFVSACVGVAEQVSAANFSVYPNPNNGNFTIDYPAYENAVPLMMYNSLGQIAGEWVMNSNRLMIDMQSLPAGVYFLQMTTAAGKSTMRIVKQ